MDVSNRADLVGALSTVRVEWRGEQITLHPHEDVQDKPSPFDAWLEWQSAALTHDFVETVWWVIVILPAPNTESWPSVLDALRWPVRVALENIGHVGRAEPITIAGAEHSYKLPAIRYTFTKIERP